MSIFTVWLKDTFERAASAFVLAFIALVPLDSITDLNISNGKAALSAGVLAGLVVIKSAIASRLGNRSSGSVIPDLPADQVVADPKQG